jgi:hypothetical protein
MYNSHRHHLEKKGTRTSDDNKDKILKNYQKSILKGIKKIIEIHG